MILIIGAGSRTGRELVEAAARGGGAGAIAHPFGPRT